MFNAMDEPYIMGGKMLGGKTGFTDQAGLCLASIAEIDGEYYTLVTMGAPGSHYTEPFHINDALALYERLSEDYEKQYLNSDSTDYTDESVYDDTDEDTYY
jgi:D-alanyl-D-alanine carboxypeptidase (penicillin-binding protein 5/6)